MEVAGCGGLGKTGANKLAGCSIGQSAGIIIMSGNWQEMCREVGGEGGEGRRDVGVGEEGGSLGWVGGRWGKHRGAEGGGRWGEERVVEGGVGWVEGGGGGGGWKGGEGNTKSKEAYILMTATAPQH
jgi:hypothetical protein